MAFASEITDWGNEAGRFIRQRGAGRKSWVLSISLVVALTLVVLMAQGAQSPLGVSAQTPSALSSRWTGAFLGNGVRGESTSRQLPRSRRQD